MTEPRRYSIFDDGGHHRLTRFILGMIVACSLLWTCLEWNSDAPPLFDFDIDDISVDLDMLPKLERNDMIAAPTHDQDDESEKLRKTEEEHIDEKEKLAEELKFVPEGGDDMAEVEQLQEDEVPPIALDFEGKELPERVVEELAEFPGGYGELVQWLTKNLKYPAVAQRNRLKGEVMVEFLVEKDGTVTNMKLVSTAAASLNAEVERVMAMMPKWKPATNHGKTVRSMIHIPVVFAL